MELAGYFVFWTLDNVLVLAKLGLFRKNPNAFSRPSIGAWLFALVCGLLYHGKRVVRLRAAGRAMRRSVAVGEGAGRGAGSSLGDLADNERQLRTSLLNFLKNAFDLVPSALESGLAERLGVGVNEGLVGACGAASGVVSCVQVACGLCDLKMVV